MRDPSANDGPRPPSSKPRLLRILGPGLVTGASDDDPSGIATYTQAGAQFGYSVSWTLLLSYPLMVAIQMISARIGRTTGAGIAKNLRRFYPNWIAYAGVSLLIVANTINLGADIGAMAESVRLLAGGPQALYVVAFGVVCALSQIFLKYKRYVAILKWLTLALFAYVATLFFVNVDWGRLLVGLVVPRIAVDSGAMTVVVAILGTTISPYLFFWQSSQEVEDTKAAPRRKPLKRAPDQAEDANARIRLDTAVGMAFSNLIAIAAATAAGVLLNFTPINPIEALFWSAVVNGVIAVPIMAMMVLMATNPRVMGPFTIGRPLRVLGWLSTAVMGVAAVGMIALSF